MKFSFLVPIIFLSFNAFISAQNADILIENVSSTSVSNTAVSPEPFAKTITNEQLKKHLSILASDEFEGRETGTPGNEKAAKYIADEFKRMGIPPVINGDSYFQNVVFNWSQWDDIGIEVNGKRFRHLWEFISFPTRNHDLPQLETDEIIFLGYGIDDKNYSDYKSVDVKDKVILVYKGEPVDKNGISYLTGNSELSDWANNWEKKVEVAKSHGVKLVLFIENEIQKVLSENRKLLIGPRLTLGDDATSYEKYSNSCHINTNVAKEIMGNHYKKVVKARKKIEKKGVSKPITLKCKFNLHQKKKERILQGVNVLGYIEGTDEMLKDELVIVTAHYDHLGKRGDDIYNGADDNGSGTSTVLEVAEAFMEAKKKGVGPRRSVLTMLVTGEEKGLLGSKFYVEKPVFPIDKTVVDINVDMVGRIDKKYIDNPNYIYVIGSDRLSTELHEINESVNEEYTQLTLDYTYNAKDDPNRYYYRSDHYNFAERGIPAIFYFNGTHADYHRTSDTIEKINFEKMELIAQLVFHTAWEIANRDKKIEVDVFDED
jgi:Peptidase family M28